MPSTIIISDFEPKFIEIIDWVNNIGFTEVLEVPASTAGYLLHFSFSLPGLSIESRDSLKFQSDN
jgi:hypothetical protein